MSTYLALGDSMSIDDYTGVEGGGAAQQFFRTLGDGWTLDDRTLDGCQMYGVPRDAKGDVVTLTIGGNDLLWNRERYLRDGVAAFAAEHRSLLADIRRANPAAVLIVGDIYAPSAPLNEDEARGLREANAAIRESCEQAGAILAPIHDTFRGNETTHLCLGIEPTLAGATAIAGLFRDAYLRVREEG